MTKAELITAYHALRADYSSKSWAGASASTLERLMDKLCLVTLALGYVPADKPSERGNHKIHWGV